MLSGSGKSSPYKPKYDWKQNVSTRVTSKKKYRLMHSDKGSVNNDYDEIDCSKSDKNKGARVSKHLITIIYPYLDKITRNLSKLEKAAEWNRTALIPKTRIDVTPESSSLCREEEEVKIVPDLVISVGDDNSEGNPLSPEAKLDTQLNLEEAKKRNTVIKIPKPPIDEKLRVFRKMLFQNEDTDNGLERKPVYAWENTAERDIDEDKEVRYFNLLSMVSLN